MKHLLTLFSKSHFFCLLAAFFICSCTSIEVHKCEGEIGQVIFQVDFGSGSEPGSSLPLEATSYSYGGTGEGSYVVTNTTGLNGAHWHNAPDHTPGDINGYCLLFDASSGSDVLYATPLEDLAPNRSYIFSCYVANIVSPSACGGVSVEPEVRISLLNPSWKTELGSITTGRLKTTNQIEWNQYSISFTTDSNPKDLLVEITNIVSGVCGNDLAIDDVSLAICNQVAE